mmetsp:Transcript_15665/g.29621  ORF Transcript_15665/g.29621 Transcript_15665/m.29621 type:complete len:213 (+) Transcript_15665:78-716(+)
MVTMGSACSMSLTTHLLPYVGFVFVVVFFVLPPFVCHSSHLDGHAHDSKISQPFQDTTFLVPCRFHLEIRIGVSHKEQNITQIVQDSRNGRGDRVLKSGYQTHDHKGRRGFQHGLMSPLDPIKGIRILVKARRRIQIRIRDIVLGAGLHHTPTQVRVRHDLSHQARQNDISITIGDCEFHLVVSRSNRLNRLCSRGQLCFVLLLPGIVPVGK